jgi:hypothetical protein
MLYRNDSSRVKILFQILTITITIDHVTSMDVEYVKVLSAHSWKLRTRDNTDWTCMITRCEDRVDFLLCCTRYDYLYITIDSPLLDLDDILCIGRRVGKDYSEAGEETLHRIVDWIHECGMKVHCSQ